MHPVLSTVHPKIMVEIGSDFGHLTEKLLGFCAENGGEVHTIDPAPKFDTDVFRKKYGDRLHIHKGLSVAMLPPLEKYDVVIIDGDHNWHTVHSELGIIEAHAKKRGVFPVVILHDTGWPYGRRDMYYSPESVPEQFRKPYAQKGVVPWKKEVEEEGGLNGSFCNALFEGEEQSGVLSAVEDFLQETSLSLYWKEIPGIHGAGILADTAVLKSNKDLSAYLKEFTMNEVLSTHLRTIENDRIDTVLHLKRAEKDVHETTMKLKEAQEEVFFLSEKFQHQLSLNFSTRKELQAATDALQVAMDDLQAATDALKSAENRIAELENECSALLAQRKALLGSKSWLLSAPLRTLENMRRNCMRFLRRNH